MKRRDFLKGLLAVPAIPYIPLAKAEEKWYQEFYDDGSPSAIEIVPDLPLPELIDFGNTGGHSISISGEAYKLYTKDKMMNYDTMKYEDTITNWIRQLGYTEEWYTQKHGIVQHPEMIIPVNEKTEVIIKFQSGHVERYNPKWDAKKGRFEPRVYMGVFGV